MHTHVHTHTHTLVGVGEHDNISIICTKMSYQTILWSNSLSFCRLMTTSTSLCSNDNYRDNTLQSNSLWGFTITCNLPAVRICWYQIYACSKIRDKFVRLESD